MASTDFKHINFELFLGQQNGVDYEIYRVKWGQDYTESLTNTNFIVTWLANRPYLDWNIQVIVVLLCLIVTMKDLH